MQEFRKENLLIKEGITLEEIFTEQGKGTHITNLGSFYIDLLFLTKYCSKDENTTLIYIGDYSHISYLLELFPYMFVYCYNSKVFDIDSSSGRIIIYDRNITDDDLQKWKPDTTSERMLVIINNYNIQEERKIIEKISPYAFSIDFKYLDTEEFNYLDGDIFIVPFSDPNSTDNKLFSKDIKTKIYSMNTYKELCNYINLRVRYYCSFLNIIYKNTEGYSEDLGNDLDSSIVIYILFCYYYCFNDMTTIKKSHIERKILELSKNIKLRVEHEYVDHEQQKEQILFKKQYYVLSDVINKSKILKCIAIHNIKNNDRKALYKLSDNKEYRNIIEYYPIGKSRGYNQDGFITSVKDIPSMISYIEQIRNNNLYEDDGTDSYKILDNCNVRKFVKLSSGIDFYDRIFNLIRINSRINDKKGTKIINKFFDRCIEILS